MIEQETLVAVVGAGSAGSRHLKALRQLDDVQALALSKRPERRRKLSTQGYTVASSLNAARAVGTRLCIVATETRDHAEDARQALDAGMDVLVEKPLTPTAAEAKALFSYARARRKTLFVASPFRFSRSLEDFRDKLVLVGTLQSIRVECRSYLPDWRPQRPYKDSYSARAGDGGVLRDLIHEVDYAGWLFGWPSTVTASLQNTGALEIESEEIAELSWTTPAGTPLTMTLDYLTRTPRRGIHVQGSKGTLTWDALAGTVELNVAGLELNVEPELNEEFSETAVDPELMRHESPDEILDESLDETLDEMRDESLDETPESMPESMDDLFERQDLAFVEHRSSPDERLATALDGIRALAICDAARLSSESGYEEAVVYPE